MHPMVYFLTWLRSREEGQGMVEYALILVLVSIVAIVALMLLGPQIALIFDQITCALEGGTWVDGACTPAPPA